MDFFTHLSANEKMILVGHCLGGISVTCASLVFPHRIAVAVYVCAVTHTGDSLQQKLQSNRKKLSQDFTYNFENGPNCPPTSMLFPTHLQKQFLCGESSDSITQRAAMKAIPNKDSEFVMELLRSSGRAIKKCIWLKRSIKLRRFLKNGKGRYHGARSTFQRVRNACKRSRTTFLTENLRSLRQFFCLKEEIQEMKRDLKFLEAQMKDIDVKISREGRKPSEDVRIWKEEAEKIKKAVDDKFEMGKQNGYVGICPEIWHRLKMSLKVDECNLRIHQLQNRHTKFEGRYGDDDLIEVLPRKAPELKAFEMSEETICSINNWENFCNGFESFGDNSDLVHPLEKTPLFCLAFILQFFTESETTIAGLISVCWIFVLTLFCVLARQRKSRREMECWRKSTCHSEDEIPETASRNCTRCPEMTEGEVGSSSSSQKKFDGKPLQEIVPIED